MLKRTVKEEPMNKDSKQPRKPKKQKDNKKVLDIDKGEVEKAIETQNYYGHMKVAEVRRDPVDRPRSENYKPIKKPKMFKPSYKETNKAINTFRSTGLYFPQNESLKGLDKLTLAGFRENLVKPTTGKIALKFGGVQSMTRMKHNQQTK